MLNDNSASASPPGPALSPRRYLTTGLARTGMTYLSLSLAQIDGVKPPSEALRRPRRGGRANPGNYAEFRTLVGRSQRTLHPRRDRVEFVDMLLTPTEEHPVVGVKLLPLDWCWPKRYISWSPLLMRILRMGSLVDYVISNEIPVLLFVRENILKLFVSTLLAARDESWSSEHPRISDQIHLDPRTIIRDLDLIDATQQGLVELCRQFPETTTITYEDPRDEKLAAVAKALGLPSISPTGPSFHKQTSDDLHEVIENYEIIATVLAGTRYERFLSV